MKPKAALKRTATMHRAPGVAPLHKQRESQSHRRGLALVPKPEEAGRENPGAAGYSYRAPQSWFRKYDVRGRVIEEGLCLVEDTPLFRWIYSYSAEGRKMQAVLFNASQRLLEKRVYDETEQLTRKIIFAGDGSEERIDYEYNGEQGGRSIVRA
jgi:hypothetical protein